MSRHRICCVRFAVLNLLRRDVETSRMSSLLRGSEWLVDLGQEGVYVVFLSCCGFAKSVDATWLRPPGVRQVISEKRVISN